MIDIRCGFSVSEKRKKIWKTELELLNQLQQICEKHGLQYYASNGTLLGAVRHKGFIPWDDDLDVMMPRQDYEKLIEIALWELKEPYVMHIPDHKGIYYRNYARIRNKNTTALCRPDFGRNTCQGIFIDIFPMDCRPKSWFKWAVQRSCIYVLHTILTLYVYGDAPVAVSSIKVKIKKLLRKVISLYLDKQGRYEDFVQLYDKWRKRYNRAGEADYYVITHNKNVYEYKKEWFFKCEYYNFEDIKVRIPNGFDKILKKLYGDYMSFPPVEEIGVHHHIFFDPDKPYTEYVGRITLEEAVCNENNY